jgi:Amt family ammonium transporter
VYPIILAWTWGNGWLTQKGFHDFAGSGIVHLVAGTTALWGAWIVGERRALLRQREGQFHKHEVDLRSREVQAELDDLHTDFSKVAKKHFKGNEGEVFRNNSGFIVLGSLLVWASYIFFVGGRTLSMFTPRSSSSAKIILNMFISSGFSSLLSVLLKRMALSENRSTKFDALTLCNGALIGMVSISAVGDTCENWGAVLIGSISAFWYVGLVLILDFYHIDDPIEAVPVHLGGGVWGLFAAGFFDVNHGVLFDNSIKQGQFMGYQLVGIAVIFLFVSLVVVPTIVILSKTNTLRADKAIEEIGFDVAELGLPGVSEEFIEAVRERIEAKEAQERKRQVFADEEHNKVAQNSKAY